MKTRLIAVSLLGVLWMSGAVLSLPAATLPSRDEVFRMLREERFEDLEALTTELRSQKLEFYKGYSDLSRFYGLLEVSRKMEDEQWTSHLQSLEKWAQARPKSPTPLIALGKAYTDYAWAARGGGWASSVTEEGWRLFGERLDKARDYLEKAGRLPVKDPEVYRALLVVAKGQGWPREEMEAAFQKGVRIEPNYQPLYEAKAGYLLPRWHGEAGDWEAFAEEAANARGGDEGDILYMIIARSQAWSEDEDFFENTEIDYERMQRGFEASLKRKPDNIWEMNSYCYFACIALEQETAKTLFKKIDGRWEKEVWDEESAFQKWQDWALHDGPVPMSASSSNLEDPFAALVSPEKARSIMIVGGVIWGGAVLVIFLVIWLIVRNYQKSP